MSGHMSGQAHDQGRVMDAGAARYKTGIVSTSRPGFARVQFPDIDGMVSDWLPVVYPKTLKDKAIWTLDAGEHVACLMDGWMEDGCILGAIYSDADAPPAVGPDAFRTQFADGGVIEYDRKLGALSVTVAGDATINIAGHALIKAASATIDAVCEFLKVCTFKAAALFPGGIGGGAGAGTTIPGTVRAESVKSGAGIDLDGHRHTEQGDGAPTSAAQN